MSRVQFRLLGTSLVERWKDESYLTSPENLSFIHQLQCLSQRWATRPRKPKSWSKSYIDPQSRKPKDKNYVIIIYFNVNYIYIYIIVRFQPWRWRQCDSPKRCCLHKTEDQHPHHLSASSYNTALRALRLVNTRGWGKPTDLSQRGEVPEGRTNPTHQFSSLINGNCANKVNSDSNHNYAHHG